MKNIFITGIISLLSMGAMAKTLNSTDSITKHVHINEVVINAPRGRFSTGNDIATINSIPVGQLQETQARSTPEALQEQTGVWVQKTNHGGGSPIIRGLTGYQTLILIDGIRLNNATFRSGPNQYLNTIDVWSLERVDIYHGAGSVQYGSDAIGGIIALYSHTPTFASKGKVHAGGNLWGQWCSNGMERTVRGEASVSGNRIAASIGADVKNFGDLYAGKGLGKRTPTGYSEEAMDAKLMWKASPNMTMTAAFQYLVQHDVPLYHKLTDGAYERNHFLLQDRSLVYLRSDYSTRLPWLETIQATVSFHKQGEQRELKKTANDYRTDEADNIRSWGLIVDTESTITSFWQARTGVDFYYDRVGSSAFDENLSTGSRVDKRGLYPDNSGAAQWSAFTLHEWTWRQWTYSGGMRYSVHHMGLQDDTFGDIRLHPSAWVANAGVSFNISTRLRWKASVNSSFRAPNINDVASFGIADHRFEIPCYNLRPERGLNSETGLHYHSAVTHISAVVYLNKMRDLVRNVPSQWNGTDSLNGQKVYCRENVDKAHIYGFEMTAEHYFMKCWRMYGNIASTFGESLPDREPLRRIPPLFGMIGLRYGWKNVNLRAEWQAAAYQSRLSADDRADNRIPQGGTPGWNVLNFNVGYQHTWCKISCTLGNVFNNAYRVHGSGIDGYGRYLKITAGITII